MSFRLAESKKSVSVNNSSIKGNLPPKKEEKVYTQVDIDLLDEKYKEKDDLLKKFISHTPSNLLLEQYKKNLVQDKPFEKETIVYDVVTRKWKIVKKDN